jgi:ribosomal protein S18 acetylase RimI-like enzyme
MEIRLIHAEECATLGHITLDAYRQLNGSEPLGSYEEELLDVQARSFDSEVYVALDDGGQLMGGVTYVPGPDRAMAEFHDPAACGIRMLAVSPAFQGRGAGRALVEKCVARAREQGRGRIILHSAPAMTLAQAMYVKMGFARAPELDEFIHDGADHDGVSLHLRAFDLTI